MTRVGVVVTCFEQGAEITGAVRSVLDQTVPPAEVVVVDDGSRSAVTHAALDALPSTVRVLRTANAGVAAARNRGIEMLGTARVAVLDGDDLWDPRFLAATTALLDADPCCVAASSWLRLFGETSRVVRPSGGTLTAFLPRNACPASAVFDRTRWRAAGGYAEAMRHGFEDWDLFLSLLEEGGRIDVVPEALLHYRTHPASLNVTSMAERLGRLREVVLRHETAFHEHLLDALLGLEATSMERLQRWERLVSADASLPLPEPSFGDGGMAAAVRIAAARRTAPPAGLSAPDAPPRPGDDDRGRRPRPR